MHDIGEQGWNTLLTSLLKCFCSDKALWGQIQASAWWLNARRMSYHVYTDILLLLQMAGNAHALLQVYTLSHGWAGPIWGLFEELIERKRKMDTCLSGHMLTSKTTQCWSTEERHLLTFRISSPFNSLEKNSNKHGSPPKSKGWDREWENISLTFNTLRNDGICGKYGVR